MKLPSFVAAFCLVLTVPSAHAGRERADLKEIKQIVIDVERIRRMTPEEQKKEIEPFYRKIARRASETFAFHLVARKVDYNEGRDTMTPQAWVEKAWARTPDAYQYLAWNTRALAFEILGKHRAELRPFIVADLASKNDKDVKWALHVIREIAGKEYLEPVLEVLDKNPACADWAIGAMRYMDEPRAIDALVKRYPDLAEIAEVLSTLQHKRKASLVLVARLDSNDAKVRVRAAVALGESGDPALVGRIERLLRDDDPQVRSAAVRMGLNLDKDAYQKVRPAIVAVTRDADPEVKRFVLWALAFRRDPACGPAILERARDAKLTQKERYEVVSMIHNLTGSTFGYDTSEKGWRPDTLNNQEALRRFAEWVEMNSRQQKAKDAN